MSLLVVRHADAGDRGAWAGSDHERPLTPRGVSEAEALAALHAAADVERIVSSPYRRCMQTVQPLADLLGLPVEEDDALAEGAPFDRIDQLLRRSSGHRDVVLCSHGDVIGGIVTVLRQRGVELGDEPRWRKASTWVIDRWPATGTARLLPRPEPA